MAETAAERLEKQLDFLMAVEPLRRVERRSPVIDAGRKENSGEHSWHVALLAWLTAEHANEPVDAAKVIAMLLLHDIGEVEAGDVMIYDTEARAAHEAEERAAVQRLAARLPDDQRDKVLALWEEFEAAETPEARFAKAMDRLQPMLLNYYSRGEAWAENGIREHQVRTVNSPIQQGSETLWRRAKQLIADAVAEGFLKT